ncbi:MAG: hypothetical protein WKH68_09425, partial [Candidatus Limnocylindria bacterium]
FTGLRPGEKLEETLFGTDEEALETDSPFLLVARLGDEGPLGSTNPLAAHLEALAGEGRDAELRDQLSATAATSAARG